MEKKEVIKHSSAIHITNEVNLLQRRAWNIMLAQAYNDLPDQETYSLTVRELCDALGYKGNNIKYIKQILRDLIGITVEWNVLGKDGSEEWGASSLLAEVKIINGVCHYAYGPTMRDRLYNPTMSARISLSLQNKFNSKHSLALYELFVDYYDVSRGRGETPYIPIQDFRRLLGLKEEEYRAFKDLNRCIIKKALKEINEKSDLQVEVEHRKQGRVVGSVKFLIRLNPHKQSAIKPLLSRKEQLTRDQRVMDVAMARYEKMGVREQEAFLDEFRGYLEDTGNRIIVERYDLAGISPGPVEGMFKAFVLERLGEL